MTMGTPSYKLPDPTAGIRRVLEGDLALLLKAEAMTLSKPPAPRNPNAPEWPQPLAPHAFHGIAGEIVRTIEPHTEADPAALLIQFLMAFGNAIGGRAYFRVEADRHRANLFAVLVGTTSKARKGTSWGHIRRLFEQADVEWERKRIAPGLSSGEGLIWAVRDAIEKKKTSRGTSRGTESETEGEDEGITDKRLLVTEEEFSSPLRVMERAGNNLSAVVRDAWGRGDLQMLTKNSPARATGAHVSILGHVTREELLRYLNSTEASNGFANRFLWVCVKRSKTLPEGGSFRAEDHGELLGQLRETIRFGKQSQELFRDEGARAIWFNVYGPLSEGKPGMFGSVTGRSEAQVVRLSLIFALLDRSAVIRPSHMLAALAVWDYCEASARLIFGDKLGDPDADRILAELRAAPEGLTRTEIRDLFQRHRGEAAISSALGRLEEHGLARRRKSSTEGRPEELWIACERATKAT
jgi:hypothetical protein